MPGIKKVVTSTVFQGQSDIVVFDEVADYNTASFSSVTASGESVGQVSGDSSEYTGEDAETENWMDEQGNIITSTPSAGTIAFAFNMANLSAENVEKYLKGQKMTGLTSSLLNDVKSAVGFGVELPTITRPIGWFNDEGKRCLFIPKGKIVSSLAYDDGHFTIRTSVTAEYINSATLKTAMIFDATPQYEETA